MATKSVISTMRCDEALKTFATFRVAGDNLASDELTQLLNIRPTHFHEKGQQYSTGISNINPKTGVWLFSTDAITISRDFYDHLYLILFILGLGLSTNSVGASWTVNTKREYSSMAKLIELRNFMARNKLESTITFFWHGPSRASYPKIPDGLAGLLSLIPIKLEIDFDRDEVAPSRRQKVG